MIQVEFSQLATDALSLRIGVVVRYGENGPVRFAQLVIDDLALDWDSMNVLQIWLTRQVNRYLDAEYDVAPPLEDPLF